MTPQQIKASICALFEAKEEDGMLLVTTPLINPGNDNIVVYIAPSSNGKCLLDDNGETAFNLSLAGVDTASETFSQSLVAWLHDSPVSWHAMDETLRLEVDTQDIGGAILAMAQAAAHIASSATSKQERERGEFKENLLELLRSISVQAGVAAEFDVPVAGALLHADCRFDTPVPTFIIAATSAVKLMEAELIHSQLQIRNEKGYVVAVVESVKKVGKMQFSRASYLTDRAVEFDQSLFKSFLEKHLAQDSPLH